MIRRWIPFLNQIARPSFRTLKEREIMVLSTTGYPIHCTLLEPQQSHSLPAILLCPPHHQGKDFFQQQSPILAQNLAQLGFRVLCFDPAGRGASWGEEDYGGREHQDNALQCLRQLDTMSSTILVLSIGTGLSTALGAIARHNNIHCLLDVDGLSDRELILEQQHQYPNPDDYFWKYREPLQQITSISCGYIRLQCHSDIRNASRIFRQLDGLTTSFFQFNEHPRGATPLPFASSIHSTKQLHRMLTRSLRHLKIDDE